ncbi:HNH endonuclease [Nioella ostreopsis]|uniref:HNH endonuclease n=1 Tax=Nioella ostreopsis TaxID=2448479 RepID=UPI000FD910D1|nr:HNH endonuclease signature motif containing protein [Nioella ostreopsis]
MPRPPHVCQCGNTVAHDQRCACQIKATRDRNQRHDRNRPNARQRGYTREWERESKLFLAYNPVCATPRCGAIADLVDHIIPHKGDKDLFWDRSNWQPLCTHCHNSVKQRQERSGECI